MSVPFQMCAEGLHVSCIRFGPLPNTVGGNRLECCCLCHHGSGHDSLWKPSDADRMATYFAFEYANDPRVEQIVEGVPQHEPLSPDMTRLIRSRSRGTRPPQPDQEETLHIDGCALPGNHEGPCQDAHGNWDFDTFPRVPQPDPKEKE